jgi:ATP-dependent helicase/nuclease subunit A
VETVFDSELWTRAQASNRVLAEVPFSAAHVAETKQDSPKVDDDAPVKGKKQLDLFGAGPAATATTEEATPALDSREILEGVIDLAFREKGGWVIADYKTDVGTDPDFGSRLEAYRRQVDLYADAWTRLTGDPVKERVLFFTAQGRVESW